MDFNTTIIVIIITLIAGATLGWIRYRFYDPEIGFGFMRNIESRKDKNN